MYDHNEKMTGYLTQFIKRNTAVLHVNLDQTQLTEGMLWTIGKALKRSPSLVSMHLSGNPGITTELKL